MSTVQSHLNHPGPLAQELLSLQARLSEQLPAEMLQRLSAAITAMVDARPGRAALRVGDTAAAFALPALDGRTVSLSDQLDRGPVVLTFYRGSWCPYCDLQLRAFSNLMPTLAALGVQLLAVSPQRPDVPLPNAAEHRELGFPLLTDAGNRVAGAYGLVYRIDAAMQSVLEGFGLDLAAVNGTTTWELPVPATFVIARNRRIRWTFVEDDYRIRAEPDDILRALKGV